MMLAHTIEAMVGDKPARVSLQHVQVTARLQGSTSRSGGCQDREARGEPLSIVIEGWGISRCEDYSPSAKFELGDVLEHPTFGRGVATAVKDGAKIEVLFETGSKTLVHGR